MAPLKPQRAIKDRERERERRGKEGRMRGVEALRKAWKTIISGQSNKLGK